jgi:hypothetical protein
MDLLATQVEVYAAKKSPTDPTTFFISIPN